MQGSKIFCAKYFTKFAFDLDGFGYAVDFVNLIDLISVVSCLICIQGYNAA